MCFGLRAPVLLQRGLDGMKRLGENSFHMQ